MPAAAARPVARLTSPGEIAAVVPVLCGFVPHESLVVVALHGPRKRIGLTMRFDLDWCDEAGLAPAEIAERLAYDGASVALVVLHSETPDAQTPDAGGLARAGLVAGVGQACEAKGIPLSEALLVRAGRWFSYFCTGPCCPGAGTPLEAGSTPALQLVEAQRALDGRAVLASREELVRSLAPPVLLAAAAAEQQLDRAVDAWLDRCHRDGREAARRDGIAAARAALKRSLTPGGIDLADAAELAIAVQDRLVRDEIATWSLTRHDALLAMLLQTARLVVPPDDAAVCTLLAWVAYAQGDGGLANIALARALTSDPDYSLALLLREGLDRQVPPKEVRRLLKATRKDLRR